MSDKVIAIPYTLLKGHAGYWYEEDKEIVMREEVLDWIRETGIDCEITYSLINHMHCQYYLIFEDPMAALMFKLRWL